MQNEQFTYSFITKEYTCHYCGQAQVFSAANIKALQQMCAQYERKHKNCVPKQETPRTDA
jgi:hypothetical protein